MSPPAFTPVQGPLRRDGSCFAAIDLGSNNCRLLIATPSDRHFRILDSFSRIVRLGEGLAASGQISEAAITRACAALSICARKVAAHRVIGARYIATQACRIARNGAAALERIEAVSGLSFEIIDAAEEARLSVDACLDLARSDVDHLLVLDIGGGSTELAWVELRNQNKSAQRRRSGTIVKWMSLPIGVVTLAERYPETTPHHVWFQQMQEEILAALNDFDADRAIHTAFAQGRAQLIGTSGAATSLTAIALGLRRYERRRVDGRIMQISDLRQAIADLAALGPFGRMANPCIGQGRADLVLPGAAILSALMEAFAAVEICVADRGLREGLLLSMMYGSDPN
ncbi:MAG TPA: exopolyphosphatase [Hyphomonadaceae bacterium]|nr:exopolyphosphatase [Hyphomonadaceae bacterium]